MDCINRNSSSHHQKYKLLRNKDPRASISVEWGKILFAFLNKTYCNGSTRNVFFKLEPFWIDWIVFYIFAGLVWINTDLNGLGAIFLSVSESVRIKPNQFTSKIVTIGMFQMFEFQSSPKRCYLTKGNKTMRKSVLS